MTRILFALQFGMFATVASAASATGADAKVVKIVHVETGKVLAIENDSDEAEAKAALVKDGKGDGQLWLVEKDGDFVKLTNKKSGKVLDVNNDSTDEGGSIIQWDSKDEGNNNQRWSWTGKGDEKRLKSKSSGLVVVPDSDGTLIQKKADEKSKAQLWKVVEVMK